MAFSLTSFIGNSLPGISYGGSGPVGQAINSAIGGVAGAANNAVNGAVNSAASGLSRLAPAPLKSVLTGDPAALVASSSGVTDLRARLSPLNPDDWFGSGVMQPLTQTNGVIFPYTPTIQFAQSVSYADLQLVHSDTDYPAYTRTPTSTLTVTGKFTVQNQHEGQYAMAVIHFLRTVSKSYFGETDAGSGKAGLPPPVLAFSAYGAYVFNQVRCVLKSHSWGFDDSTDTLTINVGGGAVRLPAMFSITCELMPVQTPKRMRQDFNFNAFASGALMEGGGGWV